ncbi:MAG: hypothetical protein KC910_25085, partial [Candidatus Eremiobacteraeota bacterium]|nr:hypothetical protein [Candidatus Eremiobacteraeota bacterium]
LASADRPTRGRLQRKLGVCHERMGDLRQARQYYRSALATFGTRLPSDGLVATLSTPLRLLLSRGNEEVRRCLDRLARVLFFLGPRGWLLDTLEISLRQKLYAGRQASENPAYYEAGLLEAYALTLLSRISLPTARARLRKLAAVVRETQSDSLEKASLLRECGYLMATVGDTANALRVLLYSLEVADRVGDIHGMSLHHSIVQLVYRDLGDLAASRRHAEAGRNYALRTGNKISMALTSVELTAISARQGDLEFSRRFLAEAEEWEQRLRLPLVSVVVTLARGWHQLALANPAAALAHSHQATRDCRRRHFDYFLIESLLLEAYCLPMLADAAGLARLDRIRKEVSSHPIYQAIVQRCRGELLERTGQREQALVTLLEALDALQAANNPLQQAHCHQALARYYGEGAKKTEHEARAGELLARAGVVQPG